MRIEPAYTSVCELFRNRSVYRIPRYQRSYAWGNEQVDDFTIDLERCYKSLQDDHSFAHFFGGIISIKEAIVGAVDRHTYEIIDGQQRIATFTIFAKAIICNYHNLLEILTDIELKEIVNKRIEILENEYIKFVIERNREKLEYKVLELSVSDNDYFQKLLDDEDLTGEDKRESHRRLFIAYKRICDKVEKITKSDDVEQRVDNLERIEEVLRSVFTILHMTSNNRDDVYKLFQVLNDRGMNLTEGDLLRASTLESLEGYTDQQESAAKHWDEALSGSSEEIRKCLIWVYESLQGTRIKKSALFDDFREAIFPECHGKIDDVNAARELRDKVKAIREEISLSIKLKEGEWTYIHSPPLLNWDYKQFELLMSNLGHDLALPLLMAANKLSAVSFNALSQLVLRTFFRYKLICNGHASPLRSIYISEAVKIRENPEEYQLSSLKDRLRALVEAKANEETFRVRLELLEYSNDASNKPLKFLLIMMEYYWHWFREGNGGAPDCNDKTRILDFPGLTLEHVYAKGINNNDLIPELEAVKHKLGNLTLLDPTQNNTADNDPFEDKRHIYRASAIRITRELAELDEWSINQYKVLRKDMIDLAIKVFTI